MTGTVPRPCLLPSRSRRALTIIEATVSIVIVGVMLAASVATVASARRASGAGNDSSVALSLAQDLMDEILAQPYDDPNGSSAIPATGNRSAFDNVLDYAGWSETPPATKAGVAYTGLTGWSRTVQVRYLTSTSSDVIAATNSGIARIDVRVLRGSKEVARLTGVKTRGLPPTEACALPGNSCTNLTRPDCLARGGTPQGAGTNCFTLVAPNPSTPRVGLVALWLLDDGSGTTAREEMNSFNATLKNGPTWGAGQINKALYLDGTNDYADAAHNGKLSLLTDLSLSIWAYSTNNVGYRTLLHKGTNPTERNYSLQLFNGLTSFAFIDTTGALQRLTSINVVPLNTWTHVVVVFDNTNDKVKLYLNGALVESWTMTKSPRANSSAFTIGRSPYGDYWSGRLDDVRIYERALSDADVQLLYSGGEP